MRGAAGLALVLLAAGCGAEAKDDSGSEASVCGAFSGIQAEGTTWTWDYEVDGSSATLEAVVTALGADSATIESSYGYSTTYVTYAETTTAEYRCDADGLAITSSSRDYQSAREEGDTEGTQVTT